MIIVVIRGEVLYVARNSCLMKDQHSQAVRANAEPSPPTARQVPWRRICVAWFCFGLSTFLASLILSLLIGIGLVGFLVVLGVSEETARTIRPIYAFTCGFALPVPVSLICFWWSVRRFVLQTTTGDP